MESEGLKVNRITRSVSHTTLPQTLVKSMDGKVENLGQGNSDMHVAHGDCAQERRRVK